MALVFNLDLLSRVTKKGSNIGIDEKGNCCHVDGSEVSSSPGKAYRSILKIELYGPPRQLLLHATELRLKKT
jgi:hypothetical protein